MHEDLFIIKMIGPGNNHFVIGAREDDTVRQNAQILNGLMMPTQDLVGSDFLYLTASMMWRVPLLSVPNDNVAIVTAGHEEQTIMTEAGHRVLVADHRAEILASLQLINLYLL